jgi:S1-C subfamily serine protease
MSDFPVSPRTRIFAIIFLVVFLAIISRRSAPVLKQDARPRLVEARGDLAGDEKSTISLFDNAAPAVVYITSLAVKRDSLTLNVFEIPQGTGSGFVWDKDGYIVTNYHVIENAQAARVTLSDQTSWNAKLVGVEPDKDLAVLKIDVPAERMTPITIGSSKDLRVGQKVFAIGNPFGFDHTLTTGIISGIGREIRSVTNRPIQGVIQTDAAINPGNSGGPLLDSAGRLIGINTAILSPSGAYAGIGFAVPVDTVNRLVPQIIQYGKVRKPGLGIRVIESGSIQLRGLDGAIVADILPGSPADKAGLAPLRINRSGEIELGDVITGVDGHKVTNSDDLLNQLDAYEIGHTVVLSVWRGGNERNVEVKLLAAP